MSVMGKGIGGHKRLRGAGSEEKSAIRSFDVLPLLESRCSLSPCSRLYEERRADEKG